MFSRRLAPLLEKSGRVFFVSDGIIVESNAPSDVIK